MSTTILFFVSTVVLGGAPQRADQERSPSAANANVPASFTWRDWDADGLVDALAITPGEELQLLRNRGDGSFDDVTARSGLATVRGARFALWEDYDGDGEVDLFVGTAGGPSHLFRNEGEGVFEDVAATSGLVGEGHDLSASWLDYDADGRLDLHLISARGNHVYHALGNGLFERIEIALPPPTVAPFGFFASARAASDRGVPAPTAVEGEGRRVGERVPRDVSIAGLRGGPSVVPPGRGGTRTSVSAPPTPNATTLPTCALTVKDVTTGDCIRADSTPTLGRLYPLGPELNIDPAGNVGIGTTTPSAKLEVAGSVRVTDTLTLNPSGDQALDLASGSLYESGSRFMHAEGLANTALGHNTLSSLTSGFMNTATGSSALQFNTTGIRNTACGVEALFFNTTGYHNTANGAWALRSNTTGIRNTAIGVLALRYNTTGPYNTASGHAALRFNTTGDRNTANGASALLYNTTGGSNTASGVYALRDNTIGFLNTASGASALANNTVGTVNTASGGFALYYNTSGDKNAASGFAALKANTTGSENTASGAWALHSNTTGARNTASGYAALRQNTTGTLNTASGAYALRDNTTGIRNSGSGYAALQSNTTGSTNTASGANALRDNTTGGSNTACGGAALLLNTTGSSNTASGVSALRYNTTGYESTASGVHALRFNTTGNNNTASGFSALINNTTGSKNTAIGADALQDNTGGSGNIAIGYEAGADITRDDNIAIGNRGTDADSGVIRIGTSPAQSITFIAGIRGVTTTNADAIPVLIDSAGQLGTVSSSRRFKEDIDDMGAATERLLDLRPVRFRYRPEVQPGGTGERPLEYGLIAEEVAEVMPDLVVYDEEGAPFTVKYHLLSSMLLNELQEHVREKDAEIAELREEVETLSRLPARLAALEAELAALTQRLEDSTPRR